MNHCQILNTSETQCMQDRTFTSRNMTQLTKCLVHIWHKHIMEHDHANINTTWSEQNTKSINHIIYRKYASEAGHYAKATTSCKHITRPHKDVTIKPQGITDAIDKTFHITSRVSTGIHLPIRLAIKLYWLSVKKKLRKDGIVWVRDYFINNCRGLFFDILFMGDWDFQG